MLRANWNGKENFPENLRDENKPYLSKFLLRFSNLSVIIVEMMDIRNAVDDGNVGKLIFEIFSLFLHYFIELSVESKI